MASISVIIGGLVILLTGWFLVDSIVSLLICFILILAAWRILKEGLRVLLEATPYQVDATKMINSLLEAEGVKSLHDVHVWSISPEIHAMSCHVLIDDLSVSQAAKIRRRIEKILKARFHIDHTIMQMECQECSANDIFCKMAVESEEGKLKEPPPE